MPESSAPDDVYGIGRFEWERAFRRVDIPSRYRAAKVVGLILATYANFSDGRSARPGEVRLMDQCGLGERTVRESLRWLRGGRLIYRYATGGSAGVRNHADVYWLCIPADWRTRFVIFDEPWDDGLWEPWIPLKTA